MILPEDEFYVIRKQDINTLNILHKILVTFIEY